MSQLKQKHIHFLLLLSIVLLCIDIGFFVDRYAFKYVDSDETIMWNAASDMADGKFYTPKFYGQAYNTHVESILATVWMRFGLTVDQAVKSATLFLVYLPFWLMSFLFWRQKKWFAAMCILGVPILLPIDWQIMVGGGRGFIPGISFTSVGMSLMLFHPKKHLAIFTSAVLIGLGIVMNQNALFVVIPLGVYYFLKHGLNMKLVGLGLMGLLPAGIWLWQAHVFHQNNPMHDLHQLWSLEWSFDYFATSLSHFHELFYGLFPLIYEAGVGIILVLIAMIFVSKRQSDSAVFWSGIITLVAILIISGFNKITDGSPSVFFPYARYFLGLIYALPLLVLVLINQNIKPKYFWSLTILIAAGLILKTITISSRIVKTHKNNSGRVVISRIDDLKIQCDMMMQLKERYKADIIVFHSKADTYNYGCSSLKPDFVSIHPEYERRYWVFEKEMYEVHSNILILDWFETISPALEAAKINYIKAEDTGYPAIVLQNNTLPLIEIYQKASLNLRKHER